MSSFSLAFRLRVNAVVWAFSCRRSKTIRIRWTEPKPIASSLCLLPSLYPDFKRSLLKEASGFAFKEPENEPKTIQFLKILLGNSVLSEPPLWRRILSPSMLHSYAPPHQKSCLRAFKNMHASQHSGWKGNSGDPQFVQNIYTVRDIGNVNVKRNFSATGLETGMPKIWARMRKVERKRQYSG